MAPCCSRSPLGYRLKASRWASARWKVLCRRYSATSARSYAAVLHHLRAARRARGLISALLRWGADRKWGQAYLTREFFHQLGETMPEHVMLVVAKESAAGDDIVAGALNLIGSQVRCRGCSGQGVVSRMDSSGYD